MRSPVFDRISSVLLHSRFLGGCVLVVSLARFVNLGFLDLQAWDEGLYALRSASILHSGNWMDQTDYVPGGLATSCYPPLTFWSTAALYEVFGAKEWTTRLTSAVCGALSVLLVFLLTRHFTSDLAASLAGVLFGTNLFYSFLSRQGQLDVSYVFFLLLSAYGWSRWSGGRKAAGFLLMVLGTTGAFLSKILVGFYVPLILLGVQMIHMRHRWRWKDLLGLSAPIIVGIGLALPWHVFMYLRHGQAFVDAFFRLHLMERLSTPIEGHNPALGGLFYVNQVVVQYPEAALGVGLIALLARRKLDLERSSMPLVILSGVWWCLVFVIITVMATKLQQYMLPLSVPVAILGGVSLSFLADGKIAGRSRLALLVLLSITTMWSALWPLRTYVRGALLGIPGTNPYATFPWGMMSVAFLCAFFTLCLLAGIIRGQNWGDSGLWVGVLMLLLVVRLILEVSVSDQTQHIVGMKDVASLLRSRNVNRILYRGKDLNPALDVYLKGWDQWKTDVRLDYFLCGPSALTKGESVVEPSVPGQATFLVEETRVGAGDCFPGLATLGRDRPLLFENPAFRVYELSVR